MLTKVLALSNDLSTLDQLKTWAAQDERHLLTIAHSLVDVDGLPDIHEFHAVIVDEDALDTQIRSWVDNLQEQADGMRVILLRGEGDESTIEQTDPAAHVIHKPLSAKDLDRALINTPGEDVQTDSSDIGTDEAGDDQEDLSYLKGWIEDETLEDETPAEDPDSNEAETELKNTSDTVEEETEPEPVDEREPVQDHPVEETQPIITALPDTKVEEAAADAKLNEEQPSPLFTYTCVLIPRDEKCYLTRGIAERLGLILPWIHASRGWRLTGIAIRPTYVQWSIVLPAENNPIAVINEIKKLTSDQLFATFSELQDSENGADFWAPGYLMISGAQTTPHSLVKGFMEMTRKLQNRETQSA